MRSTAPAYADTLVLAQALVQAAPERLVWGSDWPHTTAAPGTVNDADLVDLLRACRVGRGHGPHPRGQPGAAPAFERNFSCFCCNPQVCGGAVHLHAEPLRRRERSDWADANRAAW
jgi:hypothetical protein